MHTDQLTFTRFLAALTVVFFHFGSDALPKILQPLSPTLTAGPIAVCYFFVLSGFIMAVAYYQPTANGKTRYRGAKRYWLARFARIYPVYLLALLLVAAANFRGEGSDVVTLGLNLTMLQAWVPGYALTLNSPGWSLSVEMAFYLAFPVFLLLLNRSKLSLLVVLTAIIWIGTQYFQISILNAHDTHIDSALHQFIYYHPLMHFGTFMLGLIGGAAFCSGHTRKLEGRLNGIAIIITLALIIAALQNEAALEQFLNIKFDYNNGLIAPLFLALILLLANYQGWLSGILCLPPLLLLGEASYAIYILQRPVYGIYDRLIAPQLDLSDTADFYCYLLLLIGVSIVLFKIFESPMRRTINGIRFSSDKSGS